MEPGFSYWCEQYEDKNFCLHMLASCVSLSQNLSSNCILMFQHGLVTWLVITDKKLITALRACYAHCGKFKFLTKFVHSLHNCVYRTLWKQSIILWPRIHLDLKDEWVGTEGEEMRSFHVLFYFSCILGKDSALNQQLVRDIASYIDKQSNFSLFSLKLTTCSRFNLAGCNN